MLGGEKDHIGREDQPGGCPMVAEMVMTANLSASIDGGRGLQGGHSWLGELTAPPPEGGRCLWVEEGGRWLH